MKKSNYLYAFAVASMLSVGLLAVPRPAAAQEQSGKPYDYTARAGDAYSVLARKAVQTYGIRGNIKLSRAQIIAAETLLTSTAGFPELNQGQAVSFKEADIKSAIVSAQKLSAAELAAWQTYVPGVDFNTSDNG